MLVPGAITILPDSGLFLPVISLNMVLLPAPFCPIRVIFEPNFTVKSTSSRISLWGLNSNEVFLNVTTWLACDIR